MGNTNSYTVEKSSESNDPPKKIKSLNNAIHFIATHYILTQNFDDMKKLNDVNYCNDLVILTSKILSNTLNDLNVDYLSKQINDGVETNEIKTSKVLYSKKSKLKNVDELLQKDKKQEMCIGIAKFYIKVAHIFASIVNTIGPTYTYTTETGVEVKKTIFDKHEIPENRKHTVKQNDINICSLRINALKNKSNFNGINEDDQMTIHPMFCDMNKMSDGSDKTLNDEPGFPELKDLYYDVYNSELNKFTGMSEENGKMYKKDLETLYKAFTGKLDVPDTLNEFSDIKLKSFHDGVGCSDDGIYRKPEVGTLREENFKKYAIHIRNMINMATDKQNKLLEILDEIFSYQENPQTLKKEITISKKLTFEQLNKLTKTTKDTIIDLYISCEQEFMKGIELFQNIKEDLEKNQNIKQLKTLENIEKDLLSQ